MPTRPSNLMSNFLRLYRAMSSSVVQAFRCSNPLVNALLHIASAPFVLELARLGIKMEGMIARDGHLKGASEWLVDIAAESIQIHGVENVPMSGPILFVGNHAGLGDAHALLMSSPRADTHVLARDFGILPGLRRFRQFVIVVDEARPQAALRAAIRHLQAGRSLLLYPHGQIEADPALYQEEALATLRDWSASIELFVRHVPGLAVLPVAVGGVLSRRALRNPVVRRYKDAEARHFLAATFQMMFPFYRDPNISLIFGSPLYEREASRGAVARRMARLLQQIPAEPPELKSSPGQSCNKS